MSRLLSLGSLSLGSLSLVLLLLLAGCGGGGTSTDTSPSTRIVGTWRVTNITGNGESRPCPAEIELGEDNAIACGSNDRITFRADGTYTGTNGTEDGTYSGTWEISGDLLTLSLPDSFVTSLEERISFPNDNTFLATGTQEDLSGTVVTFTRQ